MPVVLLTAYGCLESYLFAANLGVVRYLGKPIRLRDLQRVVRDAVSEWLCQRTELQVQVR